MSFCPHCSHCSKAGGAGEEAGGIVDAIAVALRSACIANQRRISGDGRVDEATAAMLIGREAGTLRNWRSQHRPIPFTKRAGRVTYALDDVAAWMAENDQKPSK